MSNVFTKLNQARADFHKLQLKKSGLNKFAGYQYFELGDFLIPAMKVMADNGLCAFISFGTDLATMTIYETDKEPNEANFIEITSPMSTAALKGCHEVQNLGAVQTYLRRYLWVAALEIVEHDALDSSKPITETKQPKGGAMAGIGDDLSDDLKAHITEVAEYLDGLVDAGQVAKAKTEKAAYNFMGDEEIYLDRMMATNTRNKIRNFKPTEAVPA